MKTRRKVYFSEGNEAVSVKDLETEKQSRLTWEGSHSNIENGGGTDSIIQTYSGEVDGTHYGNTNTGKSAAVFGEANNNGADHVLMGGKHNKANSPCSIVGGYYNVGKADTLLEIGAGTSDKGENIFEVYKDGSARSAKSTTERDDGQTLTTKDYVDDKIKKLLV